MKIKNIAHRYRLLASGMKAMGVSGEIPFRGQMSTDRFGRNDADDRFMVAAAKLAFDLALPTETSCAIVLSLPDRGEIWVRYLFEKAVDGFYDVVLNPLEWQARCGGRLRWSISQQTIGIENILPTMKTDVVLDNLPTGRRIIIDTKFTSIVKRRRYREETLSSGYLYQMYAHLRSQIGRGDARADSANGLLLHPSIGLMVDEKVKIQGHHIRFATVDLTSSPVEIRSQLLRLCVPMLHTCEP